MYRVFGFMTFATAIVLAGCKPTEAPRAKKSAKLPVVEKKQPADKPEVRKPEQPPVVGERNVAAADQEELIQCLGHEDMAVKQEASDRLMAEGADAVPVLIEALDDENYHVRAGAVFVLGRIGSDAKPASAKLEKLATEDEWEVVRDAAQFALHAINSE